MADGFSDIRVRLLDAGPERPFKLFWLWARETWYSLREKEYDPHDPRCVQMCSDVLDGRALPIPQEALTLQIQVEGLSRVALAQITRGRVGWGYAVTSQMPEPIRHAVTVPLNIVRDPVFGPRAAELSQLSRNLYDDMIVAGIPPQDCRYLTLHGQQTNLVMYVNFMALRGYFARRCENGLTDELNLVGRLIRRELVREHLNSDGSDRQFGSGWSRLLGKLDAMGGDKRCLNNDRVFGNTGRAPAAGEWVPSLISEDNPSDYDFSRSAWYLELQELPDDLLFPGEAEMVRDFRELGFEGRLHKLAAAG